MLTRSGDSGPDRALPSSFGLSRRRMLVLAGLGSVVAAGGLSGCTEPPAAPPPPLEPDELAVNRAISNARTLHAETLALAGARPELAALLRRAAAVHEEHLVALGTPLAAASAGSTPSTSGSAGAGATPAPSPAPSDTRLLKAEIAAARTALRDGLAAAPAFGLLLTRIAAARVVNADLLSVATGRKLSGRLRPAAAAVSPSPSGSPATPAAPTSAAPTSASPAASEPVQIPTPADLTGLSRPDTPARVALNRLLAGEHAAVFAYPLVIARVDSTRSALAAALWQEHRTQRDELTERLLDDGVRPAVPEPAYDVGAPPATSAKAAALAARVERGLAALAADLLAAAPAGDADRVLGADLLVLAARRTAGWTSRPAAFPGLIPKPTPATTTAPPATGRPTPSAGATPAPTATAPTSSAPTIPGAAPTSPGSRQSNRLNRPGAAPPPR